MPDDTTRHTPDGGVARLLRRLGGLLGSLVRLLLLDRELGLVGLGFLHLTFGHVEISFLANPWDWSMIAESSHFTAHLGVISGQRTTFRGIAAGRRLTNSLLSALENSEKERSEITLLFWRPINTTSSPTLASGT